MPVRLTILLFDGYTAMDVVGGYEVLASLPGMEVEFVAAEKGLVAADTRRLGLMAYRSFAEVVDTDILYVPGGPGVNGRLDDEVFLHYLRTLHATSTWTIGICNGVGLLAAAGILHDKAATTNWGWRERVASDGVTVVRERYHRDGKIVTSAGVSSSIDAGLYLARLIAGEDIARLVQLGVEYYPDPPFGEKSVDDVPEAEKDLMRAWEADTGQARLVEAVPPFITGRDQFV